MRRVLLAGAIALAVGVPAPTRAQNPTGDTLSYRVKKDDSLGLIAAELYGDRGKAIFIMVANKIERPRRLRPGERLKIPASRQITTAPGDTFGALAATYLGDERRAPLLAELNHMAPDASLAAGTALWIPFTVTHTASHTESVTSLAATYLGDARHAAMIRRYNFLDKDTIAKGEQVVVPVHNVRLQPAKLPTLDAASKERRERQRVTQARATKALPVAHQALREGDFAGLEAALAALEPDLDYLEAEQALEVGLLLGALHVAHDDARSAVELFRRVLARRPAQPLHAYHHSPKLLRLWKEAGGTVQ